MSDRDPDFAIVGLGKMGGNLARQALEKGLQVAGYAPNGAPADLSDHGLMAAQSLEGLRDVLKPPRRVFLYVPAGKAVDEVLQELSPLLTVGDVVVDGGNSYWGDSIDRQQRLAEHGLHFCDVGTSGGIEGARHGACFMAGGTATAVDLIEPILLALATPGGYVRTGGPGSAHFTKLVHNGIEFGMLQAIAEGIGLLEGFREPLPVANILRCWQHGSVIRSWLVELMERGYRETSALHEVEPVVEDTGEVNWLVQDAIEMEVPIPVISQAVMALFASRDEQRTWARAVAAMRHGFGGHPYGHNEAIKRGRKSSRVRGTERNAAEVLNKASNPRS